MSGDFCYPRAKYMTSDVSCEKNKKCHYVVTLSEFTLWIHDWQCLSDPPFKKHCRSGSLTSAEKKQKTVRKVREKKSLWYILFDCGKCQKREFKIAPLKDFLSPLGMFCAKLNCQRFSFDCHIWLWDEPRPIFCFRLNYSLKRIYQDKKCAHLPHWGIHSGGGGVRVAAVSDLWCFQCCFLCPVRWLWAVDLLSIYIMAGCESNSQADA